YLSLCVCCFFYVFFFFCFFFFFFQAEDGIRDLTVTGVQTCALPIARSAAGPAGVSGVAARGHRAALLTAPTGLAPSWGPSAGGEIGRASCRERGEGRGGAGAVQKESRREKWRHGE